MDPSHPLGRARSARSRPATTSRRRFVSGGSAVLTGVLAPARGAGAHRSTQPGATPAPSPAGAATVGGGEPARSITRGEYLTQLRDHFPLEPIGAPGGQVIFGSVYDIGSLNPLVPGDPASLYILGQLYSTLTITSPIDGSLVPDLADAWTIGDDGVTYTFALHPGAAWHDGEPVTAHDCVFTFDVVLAEEGPSPSRSSILRILEAYHAVDDQTLRLVARQPTATFVEQVSGVPFIARHIWESIPLDAIAADPGSTGSDPTRVVGSGPFVFEEWVAREHVTLRRNPNYWVPELAPNIDLFTMKLVPDEPSLIASLQTGEIDCCAVPFQQAETIEQDPDLRLHVYDTRTFVFFTMMLDPDETTLFTDRRVRQALMYALDRDLIAETVFQGYAIRADGTQPVLSPAYRPEEVKRIYDFDPDRARALLDEAGWTQVADGGREKDGTRLRFECLYTETSSTLELQIPYMRQAWRTIGVDMVPRAMAFPVLLDTLDAGAYEMAVLGFAWSTDGSQGDMFRCDAVPPDGFNMMRYCNEEYDRLDRLQQAELDPDTRIDLLVQLSNIANDDVAAGIVVFRKDAMGSSRTLHNFLPNSFGEFWSLPFIWRESS